MMSDRFIGNIYYSIRVSLNFSAEIQVGQVAGLCFCLRAVLSAKSVFAWSRVGRLFSHLAQIAQFIAMILTLCQFIGAA